MTLPLSLPIGFATVVLTVLLGNGPPSHGITIPLAEALPYQAPVQVRRSTRPDLGHEERVVALTIWAEARSEGDPGMRAIANVIVNRTHAHNTRFGNGATEVVWRHKQFSCWDPKDPNRFAMRGIAALPRTSLDYARWLSAKAIAHAALAGRLKDRTGGATSYHTGASKPVWDANVMLTRVAWGHSFFRSAPERT